mmetsp:Transcript_19013/g.54331  ORF Transcript_19013/g.54331 Transcript_19013/m.54331 type:complete len:362 (-) Transcript_19013:238-1323(-)
MRFTRSHHRVHDVRPALVVAHAEEVAQLVRHDRRRDCDAARVLNHGTRPGVHAEAIHPREAGRRRGEVLAREEDARVDGHAQGALQRRPLPGDVDGERVQEAGRRDLVARARVAALGAIISAPRVVHPVAAVAPRVGAAGIRERARVAVGIAVAPRHLPDQDGHDAAVQLVAVVQAVGRALGVNVVHHVEEGGRVRLDVGAVPRVALLVVEDDDADVLRRAGRALVRAERALEEVVVVVAVAVVVVAAQVAPERVGRVRRVALRVHAARARPGVVARVEDGVLAVAPRELEHAAPIHADDGLRVAGARARRDAAALSSFGVRRGPLVVAAARAGARGGGAVRAHRELLVAPVEGAEVGLQV